MTKKNPYPKIDHGECSICKGQQRAWEEGRASRDPEVSEHHVVIKNLRAALVAEHKKLTEQAEIVSELVEAVKLAQAFLENVVSVSTEFIPGEGALASVLTNAIAKAKGE